ncbi:unnamed protein product [Caenorhabditis nigoni]
MSDGGDQTQAQRPWASPRVQPIKGIVQPRVLPPFGKPTRHTNKLDYIMTVVLKEAAKHKHVWPFQKPVDAHTLCIPLYHERITRPMDLKTIESRLKSVYYTSAQECIDDIEQVFQNCYMFNGKEDDVTIMAQNVHEVIKKSLEQAPRDEHDMDVHWGKNKKKVGSKELGVKASAKKDARQASEAPSETGSEAPAAAGASAATPAAKPERKVAGKKTGKRKNDSDDEEKPETHRSKREVAVVKKEATHPVLPIMKPCIKLLAEFYNKKYQEFAWVFYEPVDAATMGLHDYHNIIKHPMDMKTIKKKLEAGQYKEPAEFESDIRLMINNCLTYNPVGDPVNSFGLRFQEVFNKKWSELVDATSSSRASSVAPSAPPAVTATPKVSKKEAKKESIAKEIKAEARTPFYEQGGLAKTEDMMQINNALSMIREREEKLKAELAAAEALEQKLVALKGRREGHPNEPFPDKLITETRIMCTTPIGQGMFNSSSSGSSSANSSANRNGRVKKPNPTARQHGYDFDSDDEENKPALSYDEKRNLSHEVNRLPPQHLSTIIAIITRRDNSALNHQSIDESEIELDFESLGDMCLREMSAFMKTLGVKEEKAPELPAPQQKAPRAASDATAGPSGAKSSGGGSSSKNDKKNRLAEKNFNMSESSDDETSSRKRRKKESSDSESSSSSDDDSDDEGPSIPRKSGQPPSSREWNQSAQQQPPPRMGGMGGQPPMSRPAAVPNMTSKNAPSSSYQAPPPAPPTVSKPTTTATPAAAVAPSKPAKSSQPTAPSVSAGQPPKKKQATSILDTLLPDTFGSSSQKLQVMPGGGPSSSNNAMTSPTENGTNGGGQVENGENEEARIHRMRMEAKRARQREDENNLTLTNQMEMMTAFEFDNTY